MNKAYDKYLPKAEEKKALQAKVRTNIYEPADELRKKMELSWVDLVEGLLQKFVDDNKK